MVGIRTAWRANLQPLDDALAFFEHGQEVIGDATQMTVDTGILDTIKEQAQQYPQAAAPGTWRDNSTPAQKRAFFAKMRAQGKLVPGGRYVRTGGYADSIFVQALISEAVTKIVMGSTWSLAQVVGGSIAQNLAAAARFQQPFHAITDWQLLAETFNAGFILIVDDVKENMFLIAGEIGTPQFQRRGYTPSTRRRK